MGVLAGLVVELAGLEHHLLDGWILGLFGLLAVEVEVNLVANAITTAHSALCEPLLLVNLVLLCFCLTDILDLLVADSELLLNLLMFSVFTLHPWVSDDVGHGQTLVCVELEHARDEVLELL